MKVVSERLLHSIVWSRAGRQERPALCVHHRQDRQRTDYTIISETPGGQPRSREPGRQTSWRACPHTTWLAWLLHGTHSVLKEHILVCETIQNFTPYVQSTCRCVASQPEHPSHRISILHPHHVLFSKGSKAGVGKSSPRSRLTRGRRLGKSCLPWALRRLMVISGHLSQSPLDSQQMTFCTTHAHEAGEWLYPRSQRG